MHETTTPQTAAEWGALDGATAWVRHAAATTAPEDGSDAIPNTLAPAVARFLRAKYAAIARALVERHAAERAELDAARARVAELEAELAGAKGYICDLQRELIRVARVLTDTRSYEND